MHCRLQPHPDYSSPAVSSIDVDVIRRSPTKLDLHYRLSGAVAEIRLPAGAPPRRADNLWQHSCFEAFVRTAPEGPYYELNFSPSGEWAAYRLGGYRCEMSEAPLVTPPSIQIDVTPAEVEARVEIDLAGLTDLPAGARWQLGLSAIVEDLSGDRFFWALAHPPGEPDFHHKDCFAIELPAAEQP